MNNSLMASLMLFGFILWASCTFTMALSCDSCGQECAAACGSRHFRACCFNYLKKRSDPNGGTNNVLPSLFDTNNNINLATLTNNIPLVATNDISNDMSMSNVDGVPLQLELWLAKSQFIRNFLNHQHQQQVNEREPIVAMVLPSQRHNFHRAMLYNLEKMRQLGATSIPVNNMQNFDIKKRQITTTDDGNNNFTNTYNVNNSKDGTDRDDTSNKVNRQTLRQQTYDETI